MIKREADVDKYKMSIQFIIDGWAACRIAADLADETGVAIPRVEFNQAIKEFVQSDPVLDLRDFGYMYVLLKRTHYADEIIEDVSRYFERGARLHELCKAYEVRS